MAALAGATVSYLEVIEQGLRILSLLVGLSIALGLGPWVRRWARGLCRHFYNKFYGE